MTRNRRNDRIMGTAVLLVLCLGAWVAAAQSPTGSGGAGGVVATVGGRRITRANYESAARQTLADYERIRGSRPSPELEKLIRRQALERLIRTEMVIAEGLRRGIPVTEAEIDAEFRTHAFFNEGGTFNVERFRQVKAANSAEYRNTVVQIRGEIAGRKFAERVQREQSPDPAVLRAEVERGLTRASLEYVALRLAEFDGSYPEPTEAEVLDYYRKHSKDLVRSERAELTVIQVGDASSDRSRATADSLLRQLRSGMTFEGVSAELGGARSKVRVSPSDFPAWWPASPAAKAAVFATHPAPGTVLPEVFQGRDGWLIVRVDAFYPAGVAPLREVSREIRRLLREERAGGFEEHHLRALFESRKSMLRTTAYRVRYAVFDPAAMTPGEPSSTDIERYYRQHLADFSAYDAATAKIRTRALTEVRDDVKQRWRLDQRVQKARTAAARLEQAWRTGRRDRALESQAALLREPGPMPLGVPADTGYFGRVVGDSLRERGGALGTGVAPLANGTLVFHVHQMIKDFVPTFEDYAPVLRSELTTNRDEEEEAGARALYEKDPKRYAGGKALYYTELLIPYIEAIKVPLTRREVERYHLEHIDLYSAAEQIRARHILVSPEGTGAAAEEAARKEAEDLLQRLRKGEDFAELARRYSDDPPTQSKGGDLGYFGHGVMLDAFERAAFALKVGETSDPVKTEAGWHIIRVIDHLPVVAEPLAHVYPNVGADAANEKAERMALASADSVLAVARTPAQMRAIARRRNFELLSREVAFHEFPSMASHLQPLLQTLSVTQPGQIVRRGRPVKGLGVLIAWLDSIAPARTTDWASVRQGLIDEYRRSRTINMLYAKRAELDSLERSGFGLDSVAALWGGFERVTDVAPGKGIVGLGGAERVDSLVFGGARAPALAVGQTSEWVDLSKGIARIRLAELSRPGVDAVAAKIENQRRLKLEQRLQAYFSKLSETHPVRILDPVLREITLPPVPASTP